MTYNIGIVTYLGGNILNEQKRFTLRLDKNLFEKVKLQSKNNKRSIAKEIEYLLENYFKEKEKDK